MADDHRSPEQIRRDIDRERRGIDVVADELGRRLSPSHVADQVWDEVQPRLEDGGAAVVDGVRAHPIPAALVAAALGWLVVELATGENLSVEEARERAERAAELARQRVGAAAENSGAAARELGRELGESARSGWRAVTRAARTRPFALGTVVLGAGLLTGIALPARRPQPPL